MNSEYCKECKRPIRIMEEYKQTGFLLCRLLKRTIKEDLDELFKTKKPIDITKINNAFEKLIL